MRWYGKITNDINLLPDFIDYYEDQIQIAKSELSINGNVEKNMSLLPGITEARFSQLQEIEAVLNFLNIQLRKTRSETFKKYLESYNRALSSRDAEKYADGDKKVVDFDLLVNEVSLLRNKFLGIIKSLESKNYMLGHITKLRCAGLEDFEI
jgi:hypothetical protein